MMTSPLLSRLFPGHASRACQVWGDWRKFHDQLRGLVRVRDTHSWEVVGPQGADGRHDG